MLHVVCCTLRVARCVLQLYVVRCMLYVARCAWPAARTFDKTCQRVRALCQYAHCIRAQWARGERPGPAGNLPSLDSGVRRLVEHRVLHAPIGGAGGQLRLQRRAEHQEHACAVLERQAALVPTAPAGRSCLRHSRSTARERRVAHIVLTHEVSSLCLAKTGTMHRHASE